MITWQACMALALIVSHNAAVPRNQFMFTIALLCLPS